MAGRKYAQRPDPFGKRFRPERLSICREGCDAQERPEEVCEFIFHGAKIHEISDYTQTFKIDERQKIKEDRGRQEDKKTSFSLFDLLYLLCSFFILFNI
jgi:hypothetical protein